MRLGIDASFLRYGGGATYLRELLLHAGFRSEQIESIVVVGPQWLMDLLPESSYLTKKTFPWLSNTELWISKSHYRQLDAFFDREVDVVLSVAGEYAGQFRPLVAIPHNLSAFDRLYFNDWWKQRDTLRQWLSMRRQMRCSVNAEGLIFLSRFARNYLQGILPVDQTKHIVIPNGVSPVFSAPVRPQQHIDDYTPDRPFKLLCVTGITTYKNHPLLIKVVARLREMGYPVELHLIGRVLYPPAGWKLQQAISRVNRKELFVKYHGDVPQSEIADWYHKADAFVFPSSGMTMPNSVLECMSAGLPVACCDKQPLPEFVKDNGFLFLAGDHDSMLTALEKLLTQPERREQKALRAKSEVKPMDWGRSARTTFDFVAEVYKAYLSSLSSQSG